MVILFRLFPLLVLLTVNESFVAGSAETVSSEQQSIAFEQHIRPIFESKCYTCHGPKLQMNGLRLDQRSFALKGGDSGSPSFLPGNSSQSRLIRYVAGEDPAIVMPPSGQRLSATEVDLLRAWIDQGAVYPDIRSSLEEPSGEVDHWAYRPLSRPSIPEVQDQDWVRNPIDAFVLQRLEARGWKAAPQASPAGLLRRAYLDLTGLPPTLQEQEHFAANPSPEVFDHLISQLLSDPDYGERWGRHWLDLVRFAESNGYERDRAKPFVWKYRDWVIQSWNQDKPYDRFILEQLAGDELSDSSAATLVALGFTRLGPWDDEPADPEQARFDELDDLIRTTSEVFLGITLGCARCHDHKFDPLTQRDYYGMAAIFNGLTRSRSYRTELDVPLGAPEQIERSRRRDARIKELKKEIEEIRDHFWQDFLRSGRSGVPEDAVEAILSTEIRMNPEQGRLVERYQPEAARLAASALPLSSWKRIEKLEAEIERWKQEVPDLPRGYYLHELEAQPPIMHVLARGKPSSPTAVVGPIVPAVLTASQPTFPSPARTSQRRLTLARWIADRDNPLTARVLVNRVWQFHFGESLVRTPSDFGIMGEEPTHPELLDWLASWFMEQGWSIKKLHRLIMTSNTYRMGKDWNPRYASQDPENRLLWRVPHYRLQVEAIRDSILTVSGRLNDKRFGPSMFPLIQEAALEGHSDPDTVWQPSPERETDRRTIYAFIKRSMVVPMLEVLDFCDTTRSFAKRSVTSVAPQALTLFNGEFVNRQARYFAQRLIREVGIHPEDQIDRAYRLALARAPTESEKAKMVEFLRLEMEASLWERKRDRETARLEALEQMCRVILNLNEFVYPN